MLPYEHIYVFSENWTHVIQKKPEKAEVLIHNRLFYNKTILNTLCIFLFNFLFSQSTFRFYSIYLIISVINQKHEIRGKNVSSKTWKIKKLFT